MPKTTVFAGLVSCEASVLGLKIGLCPHLVFPLCSSISGVSVCVQIFSYEDTIWVVLSSS